MDGAKTFLAVWHAEQSCITEKIEIARLEQLRSLGCVYTHVDAKQQRAAAEALQRAIFEDLFPIVPQIATGNKNALTN